MPSFTQPKLPGLLLGLEREGFSGELVLRDDAAWVRTRWRSGSPIAAESSDRAGSLLAVLSDEGLLESADAGDVETTMAEKGWDALRAVAASQRVAPRELVRALGLQIERALGGTLAWKSGTVEMDYQPDAAGTAGAALPLALPALLRRAVARHWRVEDVLSAWGDRATRIPTPGPALAELRPRLAHDDAVDALASAMDARISAFALCQADPRPETWATLFVLDLVGALTWSDADDAEPTAEPVVAMPEIEIRVAGADATAEAGAGATGAGTIREDLDDRAIALRDEILGLHARLGEIDHYELLGLERDANAAQIKRAYLKAAKRLHPDRCANLGLDAAKAAANEVFAQITRAHGVLSDVDQRRSYDASLEGHTEIDADRLAQAEVFFRKGEALLKAGNFLDATELLDSAVQVWPEEPEYHAALAWALHRKNPPENERALAHFEEAERMGGEQAQWLLRMGLVVKEMGDLGRAGQLTQRARSLDPDVTA